MSRTRVYGGERQVYIARRDPQLVVLSLQLACSRKVDPKLIPWMIDLL